MRWQPSQGLAAECSGVKRDWKQSPKAVVHMRSKKSTSQVPLNYRDVPPLQALFEWCDRLYGGGIEAFQALAVDGTSKLSQQQLLSALSRLGFFSGPHAARLPPSVASEELASYNLIPVLFRPADEADHDAASGLTAERLLNLRKRLRVHLRAVHRHRVRMATL